MGLAVVRRIPPYKIALSSWERASRALPSHALKHNDMIASGPPGCRDQRLQEREEKPSLILMESLPSCAWKQNCGNAA